jgi:hypothetical protein
MRRFLNVQINETVCSTHQCQTMLEESSMKDIIARDYGCQHNVS